MFKNVKNLFNKKEKEHIIKDVAGNKLNVGDIVVYAERSYSVYNKLVFGIIKSFNNIGYVSIVIKDKTIDYRRPKEILKINKTQVPSNLIFILEE